MTIFGGRHGTTFYKYQNKSCSIQSEMPLAITPPILGVNSAYRGRKIVWGIESIPRPSQNSPPLVGLNIVQYRYQVRPQYEGK